MTRWLRPALVALGLLAFAAAVWFAGPLAGFGEVYPLEGVLARLALIGVVVLAVGAFYGWRIWRRRKAEKALEAALTDAEAEPAGDGAVLSERMGEALAVLKRASGKRTYLYELPWYVIIGPPGSGKTTALVNSGLNFPLAGREGAASVAGVGGTRYCDFWFTDEAVLIDTAGRYTTHDSDRKSDEKSWLAFLQLLKAQRPKQPVNGVILAVSLEDLMLAGEAEMASQASAICDRLVEIHRELKIDFPVYVLFTKADLVAGFADFFGNFTKARREKVWGATVQTPDRSETMVASAPQEFDALVRRLTEEVTDRLHEEPDPIARIAIYGFPAQFAMLRETIAGFLAQVFEPSRYRAKANLRGFYFSSGTQEGTPIDQVLGQIARGIGGLDAGRFLSGRGRSFFLHDLLTKVIFAESGWVSFDRAAVRRAQALRWSGFAAVGLVTLSCLGLWGWSFVGNRSLIAASEAAVANYRVTGKDELSATTVSDPDVADAATLLDIIRRMPAGYATRDEPVPLGEEFGLAQRPRLASAAETTYREGLERMLRSRIILRLERQLETLVQKNDPLAIYEALKVYLMVGGKAPRVDENLVVGWLKRDWETNLYPGPQARGLRADLEEHLLAMLQFGKRHEPRFDLNGSLIENAQRVLARMNVADQAYALIRASAFSADIADFSLAERSGVDSALVFETRDGSELTALKVPMLYTYRGFHEFFLAQLAAVAEKIKADQWVLGDLGKQAAVEEQMQRLGPELLDRYGKDFVEAWNGVLGNLKLKPMAADRPDYRALAILSSQTSPLVMLAEAVRRETALTADLSEADPAAAGSLGGGGAEAMGEAADILAQRARDRLGGLARIGLDLALKKSQIRAGSVFGQGDPARRVPGESIEAQFRHWHQLTEGEKPNRPIDALRQTYYEIHKSLVLAAANPSMSQRIEGNLQAQIGNLRASVSRLPQPLARMVEASIEDFEGDAADTSTAQLNQEMTSAVTRVCEQVISGRYPFDKASRRDVPMADFARLFAPNGIIDRFFLQNLAPYADMSGESWSWKQDSALTRNLSKAALREFQRAAQIRDAFFAQGGAMPNVAVTVDQRSQHGEVEQALLTINNQVLDTRQVGNHPMTFQWPGSMGGGEVTIHLLPPIPGREYTIREDGPWALMRMVERGAPRRRGDLVDVQYPIGGRYVDYAIRVDSVLNPFFLRAMSEFSCPTGL